MEHGQSGTSWDIVGLCGTWENSLWMLRQRCNAQILMSFAGLWHRDEEGFRAETAVF